MDVYGIDVGYGFTKIVTQAGRRASFPSVCKPATDAGLAEIFGSAAADHRLRLMTPGAGFQEWLVGRSALAADAIRSWSTAGSARADYPILVLAALAAVNAKGRVSIAVGLPLSVYADKSEQRALSIALEGLSGLVGLDGREPEEIEIASTTVYPQALGAYFSFVATPGGSALAQQEIGVVDIGYRTTDYLVVRPQGGKMRPDMELSGSIDTGIGDAMAAIGKSLAEDHRLSFPLPGTSIEEALLGNGTIGIRGQVVNVQPAYRVRVEKLGQEITETLRHIWAKRLDRLAGIVVAGGGGAAVQPFLGLPGAALIADPVYANAKGFLLLTRVEPDRKVSDTANAGPITA